MMTKEGKEKSAASGSLQTRDFLIISYALNYCATSAAPTCQNFRFGQTSFAALCSFFACWLARHVTLVGAPYEKGTAEWMFEILFAKVCVFELLRLVLVPVVGDDDDVDCGCKEV